MYSCLSVLKFCNLVVVRQISKLVDEIGSEYFEACSSRSSGSYCFMAITIFPYLSSSMLEFNGI